MEYFRPATLDEAVALLDRHDGARPLAGGATLVAMMNADLLEPSALVSLAAIGELDGIRHTPEGVSIGAMTRHASVAADTRLEHEHALVRLAAAEIGHPSIRAVGTIGGSIAHADPAADYPTALTAAGAEVEVAGPRGRRRIGAGDFFEDYYTTALEDDELVVAVHLPPSSPGGAAAYRKVARSDGDFAIASLAFSGRFDDGTCSAARIVAGGCGATPVHADAVDRQLLGAKPGDDRVTAAALALAEACDPIDDVRGSAGYRRELVRRLVPEVFAEAFARSAR